MPVVRPVLGSRTLQLVNRVSERQSPAAKKLSRLPISRPFRIEAGHSAVPSSWSAMTLLLSHSAGSAESEESSNYPHDLVPPFRPEAVDWRASVVSQTESHPLLTRSVDRNVETKARPQAAGAKRRAQIEEVNPRQPATALTAAANLIQPRPEAGPALPGSEAAAVNRSASAETGAGIGGPDFKKTVVPPGSRPATGQSEQSDQVLAGPPLTAEKALMGPAAVTDSQAATLSATPGQRTGSSGTPAQISQDSSAPAVVRRTAVPASPKSASSGKFNVKVNLAPAPQSGPVNSAARIPPELPPVLAAQPEALERSPQNTPAEEVTKNPPSAAVVIARAVSEGGTAPVATAVSGSTAAAARDTRILNRRM